MNDVAQSSGRDDDHGRRHRLEVLERGQGAPILYLHGGAGIAPTCRSSSGWRKARRVIAPSHPGFGRSVAAGLARQRRRHRPHLSRTDGPAGPDAGRSRRLLDRRLDRGRDRDQGAGAAAAARADRPGRRQDRHARQARHSRRLRDAAASKLNRLRFHDPRKNPADLGAMSDEELNIVARNRETLALLTWEPYMHNPKLKHRLHRVGVPTLFLRGASDGIVSADYLERYAALIPKARDRDHRGGRTSAAGRAARGDGRQGAGVPAILIGRRTQRSGAAR